MDASWIEEDILVSADVTLNTKLSPQGAEFAHPALILLHFWGGSSITWASFVSFLDRQRVPIIAPSMRGWGKSSKGLGSNAYYTSDYASDVACLVEKLNQLRPDLLKHGIILVGHSLGGKVAQYALMHSIVRNAIRGLLLFAPSPAGGFDFDATTLEKMRHAFDDISIAASTIKSAMLGSVARLDEAIVTSLAGDALRADRDAILAFPNYGAAEKFDRDLIEALETLDGSTQPLKALVIEGSERQENAEEHVVTILQRAGIQTHYQLLNCGHLLPVEVPAELAKVTEVFISTLS